MKPMSLRCFLMFVILSVLGSRFALAQYGEHSRYFPQVAAGQGWRSTIKLFNLDGRAGAITVKFKDDAGNPLSFSTNKGIGSSFTLQIPPLMSDVLDFYGETQLKAGSVEVTSEILFDGYLDLKQCEDCLATVMFSPSGLSFSVELNPNNGLAIFNPSQKEANVKVRAFNSSGIEITNYQTSDLKIPSGGHLAQFFNQDKFQLGNQTGVVIISSDVPISAVSLKFNGLKFAPVPVMFSPRRVDIPEANKKIGFVDFKPQGVNWKIDGPYVAQRAREFIDLFQPFCDNEMARNGFRSPCQIPWDVDENGMPKVIVVNGQSSNSSYFLLDGSVDTGKVRAEVAQAVPSNWSVYVIFGENFEFYTKDDGSKSFKGVKYNGGVGTYTSQFGSAYVSAIRLPFMKVDLFNNTNLTATTPIPEFNNATVPFVPFSDYLRNTADVSFHITAHELGHALGLMFHYGALIPYGSLVGNAGCGFFFRIDGCIPSFTIFQAREGVLLPIEAKILSIAPNLNRNDYGWIQEDDTPPEIQLVSKDLTNGNLHVVLFATDQESGISVIAITGLHNTDFAHDVVKFYKEITSTDQGNIDLLIPWSNNKPTEINLLVYNTKGGFRTLNLF